MQLDKDTLRKLRGLIIFTLVILVGLWRFSIVLQAVKTILHILFPFLLGGAIAFVLSVPMNRIRKRLFANAKEKQKKFAAPVSLILTHRSITDCLAVGSGFGYYSLSSIFITEYKGAELGTIALLANISREILTLLAAPLLVRWFGNLAPISAGGATTMDTTLPIITRTAGQQFVVVSIFHGFVVDFSVPFLVTLFCSI